MDEAQAPSSLAAMPGSPSHVHFEITTEQGNTVMIKGDPKMPEATRKALAAMIDAAVKAANAGELKAMENAALSGAKEKP
jgi:glutamine synthetase